MHIPPSRSIPNANMKPPSITRKSATAIAGRATSVRALRSELGALRTLRRGGRLLTDRRVETAGRGRLTRWVPRGLWGPPASSGPSSPAEATPARGILGERLLERLTREVGPQLVAEDELGVGRLPQQVVRQPALAARADDHVGVVHLGRVQARAELLFGASREAARSVDDLGASAVVERHEHRSEAVGFSQLFGPAHLLAQPLADALATADEAHAHAFGVQLGRLAGDPFGEHRHQALHLLGRP